MYAAGKVAWFGNMAGIMPSYMQQLLPVCMSATACAVGTNTIMAGTKSDSSIALVVAGAHTADYVGMYPAACAGGGIAIAAGTKSASFCRHLFGILYLKYHCKCCRPPAILC